MAPKPLPSQTYLRECFLYDPETGVLRWRNRPRSHFETDRDWQIWNARYAGVVAGGIARAPGRPPWSQVCLTFDGKKEKHRACRIIWKLVKGRSPEPEVDHRDCDATNQRWTNLRVADRSQNNCNRASSIREPRSLPKGVSLGKKKWTARIAIRGRQHFLGTFGTPEQAAAAYRKAAKTMHGDFANLGRTV